MMLVKFFKRGGVADNKYSTGGQAVKDYLLNERVELGTAKLLKGDPDQTTEIINGLGYSKIFTSGCLAFDADESKRVDDNLKQKLMSDFERSLFGEFDRTRVSGYWVEHSDKKDNETGGSRLELNFVFANVDLLTGKNLPVYYHANDCHRVDLFKELANLKHGLSNPNDIKRRQTTVIDIKQSQSQKDLKQAIDDHLTILASSGNLPDHVAVKQAIQDLGLTITATKNKSISIANPDPDKPRPIRLTGAFYEQQYQFSNLINQAENKPSESDRAERLNELSSRLESAISKRTQSLNERLRPSPFKTNRRKQRKDNDRVIEIRHDTDSDSRPTQQQPIPDFGVIPKFFEPNPNPSTEPYTEPNQKNGIVAEPTKPSNQRLGTVESRHDSTAHYKQTATIGDLDSFNRDSGDRGNQPINANYNKRQNVALAISLPSNNRHWCGGLGGYGCYQESKQRERINEYKSDYTISFSNVRESISRYVETTTQSLNRIATMAKSACEHLQGGIRERHSQIDRQLEQYRPIRQQHYQSTIRESAKTDSRLSEISEQFNNANKQINRPSEQLSDIGDSFNHIIQSADRRTNQIESAVRRIDDCFKIIEQKKKINKVEIEPLPTPKAEPPKQTYKPPRLR